MKKDSLFWLLSFEESKRVHKHVECTEDFYRELYELFEIARSWYLQAEKNHMKTEYFIELFERSHQYIDCDCARCKNSRQMAIGIIGTLFRDSKCVSIIKKKKIIPSRNLLSCFFNMWVLVCQSLPERNRPSSLLDANCQTDRWICW